MLEDPDAQFVVAYAEVLAATVVEGLAEVIDEIGV
jgi:hypothetical protein